MIETLWNFFRLYTADADYLPDFWLTISKSAFPPYPISFTGQTPEPDHNDNAATNEPCAASYCISLSNSMGNRALTTEEA